MKNTKKIAEVNIYYDDGDDGDDFHFCEPEYLEIGPYASYTKPFGILIDAYAAYRIIQYEEEEEYEVEITREEEEEQPITVLKAYKEDKCEVCLSKEPKVLFYDCMHYCVCLECEERKPFKSCPCCRTRISTKII